MELIPQGDPGLKSQPLAGAQDQRELAALLSACFPVPEKASFFDDFPVWDERWKTPMVRLGLRAADGSLAAAAGVRFCDLRNGPGWDRMAIIGCVATAAAHRGRGLASRLVSELIERSRNEGARAVLLFGNDSGLYSRLGFAPVGRQARLPLETLALPLPGPGIRISRGWNEAIFDLMRQRGSGLRLLEADLGWLSAHRNSEWWWIGTEAEPLAYACVGRGIDLQGFVHEWGGQRAPLLTLLGALARGRPGLQLLGSPVELRARGLLEVEPLPEPACLCLPLVKGFEWMHDTWLWGLDGA